MQNITLLSLAIVGSFQPSPFLQFPFSAKSSFNIFKNVKAHFFLSSFLISQAHHSSSIVEGSIFDHFITSNPVLAFKTSGTTISDEEFYGDKIPKDNNIFYQTEYTEITNCKFMSITDNTQEQLLPDVGLCIYTTKNTTVDGCYFFAIQSYRSGSCVLFDQEENLMVDSVVKNSIFKSISQTLIDFGNLFLTGGAISHGRARIQDNQMSSMFVNTAVTENCCFEKVRLISDMFNGRQLGLVTYLSHKIKSTNLNFTDNEMGGSSQRYGAICVYFQQISDNNIKFINIFDSEFTQYGIFSTIFNSQIEQSLTLSNANFINNTSYDDGFNPMIGIEIQIANISQLLVSNVQCNSELPFVGISAIPNITTGIKPIDVKIEQSYFKVPETSFIKNGTETAKYTRVTYKDLNNQFQQNQFDLEITNDIVSQFGYIKTSHFSPSNSFSNRFVQDSASYYDLSQDNPITAGVLATIFGIISFIVFIFLLCVRKGGSKKDYKVIGRFDNDDQFNSSHAEIDEIGELEDMQEEKKKKKAKTSTSIMETNNISGDNTATQDDLKINNSDQAKELDESNRFFNGDGYT